MTEYSFDSWPPAGWTFFGDASVWNVPIPDKTKVDPRSATLIHTLCAAGPPDVTTQTKIDRWAFPFYFGRASDPLMKIQLDSTDAPAKDINGKMIHVPPKMKASTGSDGALKIIDQAAGEIYHFRVVASIDYNAHVLKAHSGFRLALEGTGFGPTGKEPPPGLQPIRPEELQGGMINHTIPIHVKSCSGTPVPPYENSTGRGQYVSDGFPAKDHVGFGNVIFLAPSVADLDKLAIPTWQKAILKGLSVYGGLVAFNGGSSWSLTYEHPFDRTVYGKPDPWKAAGITFPLDFRNALAGLGGWEKNLRVLQPFSRPAA